MLRYVSLAAIGVIASNLPALAQQRTTAGALLKQGYTIVFHPRTMVVVMQKGSSAYACKFSSEGDGPESYAAGLRAAQCVEI